MNPLVLLTISSTRVTPRIHRISTPATDIMPMHVVAVLLNLQAIYWFSREAHASGLAHCDSFVSSDTCHGCHLRIARRA